MGTTKHTKTEKWTAPQDKIILQFLPGNVGSVYLMLNRKHDVMDCFARAMELGIEPFVLGHEEGFVPEEDAILIHFYHDREHPARSASALPYRTARDCRERVLLLHTDYKPGDMEPWTDEEHRLLAENCMKPFKEVKKFFKNRSKSACVMEAICQGFGYLMDESWTYSCSHPGTSGVIKTHLVTKKGSWAEDELQYLRENYAGQAPYVTAEHLSRSEASVVKKARELGILRTKPTRAKNTNVKSVKDPWTEEELNYLRECYPEQSVYLTARYLNRSESSVIKKARELRIMRKSDRNWSRAELEIIKKHYVEYGNDIVDLLPGRSKSAIIMKAKELKIVKKNSNVPVLWTEEEDEILSHITSENSKEIIAKLPAHTKNAILTRARQKGYLKKKQYQTTTAWTPEEEAILMENYQKLGPIETSKLLPKKSPVVVYHRAQTMGLVEES